MVVTDCGQEKKSGRILKGNALNLFQGTALPSDSIQQGEKMYRKIILVLGAFLIASCSSKIDSRNADFHRGLLYKHGSDEPFSGTVVYHQEPDVVTHYLVEARGMLGGIILSLGSDKCVVDYVEGDVEGDVSCRDSDEKKTIEFHVADGLLDGEGATYYHGDIRSRFHWSKGRANGNQRVYSQEGNITHEWSTESGRKVGPETYNAPDGDLIAEGEWDDGKFTGTHFDGKSVYTLDDGVKDGPAKVRWEAGGKVIKGNFENGTPSGEWVYPSYEMLWNDLASGRGLPPGFEDLLSMDDVDSIAVQRTGNRIDGGIQGMDKEGNVIVSFNLKEGSIQPPVVRYSPDNGVKKTYSQPSILAALNYRRKKSVLQDGYWVGPNQRAAFEAKKKSELAAQEAADEQRRALVSAVVNMTTPSMTSQNAPPSNSVDSASGADCLNHWVDAFHKERGQDAVVALDQMEEWTQWCKEGKQAPGS